MSAKYWAWVDRNWGWILLLFVLPYWITGTIQILSWVGIGEGI